MADLLSILSSSAASLAAQRAAAATASHNLQNANTPGYARQRAVLATALPAQQAGGAWIGRGATLAQVTQARDRFLEAQLPAAQGRAARSAAASSLLGAVQVLDPEAEGGPGEALGGLYAALTELSQAPSDPGLRQATVAAARTLALSLNRARQGLEDARAGADARIAAGLSDANALAAEVAALNRDIRAARAAGAGEPNDLLDARQRSVDRLAELTGATPAATSEGDVSLLLPGGSALVAGLSASTLLPQPGPDGHLSVQLATGGVCADVAPGGELGGLLDASSGPLKDAITALDQLAWAVGNQLNAVHRAGWGLDGGTGRDLLDVGATAAGAARRIAVSAAVAADPSRLATASAAGQPGDAGNVLALLATSTTRIATGQGSDLLAGLDATGALSRITGTFGAAARGLAASAAQDAGLAGHLATMRESASGVSVDEELLEMEKAQRAYEAISKVIQASSEMFDTLLKLE
ncbi:flagellar hook-associated protein FlgK [Anaeromyxobacter sp. K]|uniref:flagellar hook-associated protein FlgK n=1 Tax=Anaeromyxobacter sp. (strain K) TaxID=447217 RepID=UPI00015F8ED6|nr:flagellar hook-associated protein FlgK [Anaeromyxobacter sp. K]ACG73738.1 flagellar hook-associated protein FlgK [Anaeromyxobacter sp. K]